MDIEGLEFGGARQFFTGEYVKYAEHGPEKVPHALPGADRPQQKL